MKCYMNLPESLSLQLEQEIEPFGLTGLERQYFLHLLAHEHSLTREQPIIGENFKPLCMVDMNELPEELRYCFKQYGDIRGNPEYLRRAANTRYVNQWLAGGLSTSVQYEDKEKNRATGLEFSIRGLFGVNRLTSAEARMIRSQIDGERHYREVIDRPFVSEKTLAAVLSARNIVHHPQYAEMNGLLF